MADESWYVFSSTIYYIHEAFNPAQNTETDLLTDAKSSSPTEIKIETTDNIRVTKHRKFLPSGFDANCDNEIYEPPSEETFNPSLELPFPNSDQWYSLYGTLCIEQFMALFMSSPHINHLIQVLCSDSIDPLPFQLNATHVFIADSRYPPRHIVTTDQLSENSPTVELYVADLLEENFNLRGPLQPFHPLDFKIKDMVEALYRDFQETIRFFSNIEKRFEIFLQNKNSDEKTEHPLVRLKSALEPKPEYSLLLKDVLTRIKKSLSLNAEMTKEQIIQSYLNEIKKMLTSLKKDFEGVKAIREPLQNPLYKDIKEVVAQLNKYSTSTVGKWLGFNYTYLNFWAEKILKVINDYLANPNNQLLNSERAAPVQPILHQSHIHPAFLNAEQKSDNRNTSSEATFDPAKIHPAALKCLRI